MYPHNPRPFQHHLAYNLGTRHIHRRRVLLRSFFLRERRRRNLLILVTVMKRTVELPVIPRIFKCDQ